MDYPAKEKREFVAKNKVSVDPKVKWFVTAGFTWGLSVAVVIGFFIVALLNYEFTCCSASRTVYRRAYMNLAGTILESLPFIFTAGTILSSILVHKFLKIKRTVIALLLSVPMSLGILWAALQLSYYCAELSYLP